MKYEETNKVDSTKVDGPSSESRRGFLKLAAVTGAAVSVTRRGALANGEIGFWAKDLSDDKLVDMYRTIVKIRWHERTQADKMLGDPNYPSAPMTNRRPTAC